MKRLENCEGGHVTGLVTGDKDSVIMVLCIGTARTHKCAATAVLPYILTLKSKIIKYYFRDLKLFWLD